MLEKIMQTAVSSVIALLALFILTRMIGKKQMSQLNFFDYVIGISIGSIAAEYAIDSAISATEGLSALTVFTLFALLISFITQHTYVGRKLLDGVPTVLIENGKIIENGLKKTRLNINDLIEECRQKDAFDISKIEFAILETNGRLSILLKTQNQPITPREMNIPTEYEGLCANVIIDGKIIYEHLHAINLSRTWLQAELGKQNIKDYSDVLLAYVDSAGALCVHPKNVPTTKGKFIM